MKVLNRLANALMVCLLLACCTLTQSVIANTGEIYLAQSDETDSSGETESEDAEAEDAESEDSESEDSSTWDDCVEWLDGRFGTRPGASGGAVRG